MSSVPITASSVPRRATPSRVRVEGSDDIQIDRGWLAAAAAPGSTLGPDGIDALAWRPARVPGTAAAVQQSDGADPIGQADDLDARDWWFRTRFEAAPVEADEEVLLCFDGIATVAELELNGEPLASSDSMFAPATVDIGGRLRAVNDLAIHCRALGPLLAERRSPRARWRTRIVADGNIRWFRTTLLGRAPGFAPRPAPVGPWRPVRLERRRVVAVDALGLRPRLVGDDGVLAVQARIRPLGGRRIDRVRAIVTTSSGSHAADLTVSPSGVGSVAAVGDVLIPVVARWWPHTHGEPTLHAVRLEVETGSEAVVVEAGRIGFRTLTAGPTAAHDVLQDGLDLRINGRPIFARGAVWTPLDVVSLAPSEADLRDALLAVRDAGMNIVRIPGFSTYETPAFHDLCDEFGILVWQDLMFANLDYPFADDAFRRTAEHEVTEVIDELAGRPSLAVVCGNSEVEQQVAMLGLDPAIGRGPFFGITLPSLLDAAETDAIYVPSAPSGGDLPFRVDRGVANYYGVGGYRRPIADARSAGVRFAAECLAFANVPEPETLVEMLPEAPHALVVQHPRWKAGVPRDNGSGWDFDDVRDHYFPEVFGLDPVEVRRIDHDRYLELSRFVSAEVMAEVFGEWRRPTSSCRGALVLSMRDLVPGAGWGIVDARGRPKVAYHHLRRALAPVAVWTTDEGLGGIDVHIANDRPSPLIGRLRVAIYRDREQRVAESTETVEVAAREAITRNVETQLGRFIDASWAYRFGPPGHDLVVATLERDGPAGPEIIGQAFRHPVGRPTQVEDNARLGLEAIVARRSGAGTLTVRARRLAYGVHVRVPGFAPADDAFSLEPGVPRTIELRAVGGETSIATGEVSALNLAGVIPATLADTAEPA